MRVLVCGGRDYDDWYQLNTQLLDLVLYPIEVGEETVDDILIISGGANGADFLAKVWAKYKQIDYMEFKADWTQYGKAAGAIRNKVMLVEGRPDLVVAFPGGAGTADMIRQAKKANVEVFEVE